MQTKQAISVLSALAQESRLAIYRLLVEHVPDGLVVSAIAERLGVANTTLSFHLKELVRAGLITSRQEGRFIYYAASMAAMDDLIGYLTENCCCATGKTCAPAKGAAQGTRTRKRIAEQT
ncbi:metalloregulator ArsR/SmtB family transcription factor [Rhodanobacter sp. DHB23]|uniref:ArsR/SmtB family transcription factor n=1 Tax=Rhodanobacter sp. DHB23 TaxID=2775923 RepID=UPI00177F725D|nr:metalloregulator ArsR/SmtB family transcription factor [Rhodanobacter sp. DHB23]MBD8873573.1 winged helix-turn-helix transcriptional regulator [Rhodanobacter sp. DHB23]